MYYIYSFFSLCVLNINRHKDFMRPILYNYNIIIFYKMEDISEPGSDELSTPYTKKIITEYLDNMRTSWFPINIEFIPDGKDDFGYPKLEKVLKPVYNELYKGKTKNGYETYKPFPTDFILKPEIVEARKKAWYNGDIKCNAIWIDTRNNHQLDIDTPKVHYNYQIIYEDVPYYKSCTKEYGKHYFLNTNCAKFRGKKTNYCLKDVNEDGKLNDSKKNDKLEYLCGRPSYALIDTYVYNANYKFPPGEEYSFEAILYDYDQAIENKNITELQITDNINQNVSDILNEIFKLDTSWKIEKNLDRFIITAKNDIPCMVDGQHIHTNQQNHCVLYVNSRRVNAYCLSHNSKRLLSKEYPAIEKLKECLGLKLSKDKKNEMFSDVVIDEEIQVDDLLLEKMIYNTTTTHKCVANIFYYFFPDKFKCTNDDNTKEWFSYEMGVWTKSGSSKLREYISEHFVNILKNYSKRSREKEEDTETPREQVDYYKNIQDTFKELIVKCETVGYVDSLIKQLITKYIDRKFYEKLDTKEYLLCFGEDVYDLDKNEWRKSKNDDMMSYKCNVTKDEITNEHQDEMMKIIDSIFTDEGRKNYFLDTLARDILYGNNKKHNFHLWTGIGGNGKGVIASYIKSMLGDYYIQFDASVLTQKRTGAENANPKLAELRGKRCAMFTEPEKKSKLNIGLMNYLSGETDMSVRQLFKNLSTLKITFTCFIQCNNSFKLEEIEDNSIQRRLSFLKFTTKFSKQPKYSYERKGDSNVNSEKRLNKLKGAFMFIILERWKNISKNKNLDIDIPPCIVEDKQEFINDNDLVHTFVESNIEITDNKIDYLQVNDILERYYDWADQENEKTDQYSSGVFTNRLIQYLPEFKKRHVIKTDEGKKSEKRNSFLYCKFKFQDMTNV